MLTQSVLKCSSCGQQLQYFNNLSEYRCINKACKPTFWPLVKTDLEDVHIIEHEQGGGVL